MGATSPDALSYPDVGYTSGIRQAVEDLADTTQAALLARAGRTFRPADSTALAALSSSYTLRANDFAYQVDTGVTYRYSGSAWVAALPGMYQIIPTSAAAGSGTVSVSSLGAITATTVGTNLSVNGCFTSAYDTYVIVLNLQLSANSEVTVRLRAAGSDVSSSNYNDVRVYSTTSSNVTQALAASAFRLSIAPGAVSGWLQGDVRFIAPALASPTGFNSDVSAAVGNTAFAQSRVSGHHSLATAYDGFSLIPASGTITGTVRIYGRAN